MTKRKKKERPKNYEEKKTTNKRNELVIFSRDLYVN